MNQSAFLWLMFRLAWFGWCLNLKQIVEKMVLVDCKFLLFGMGHVRMAALPHGRTAAWPHCRMAALPHGRTAAWPHRRMAAPPHGRTAAWPHRRAALQGLHNCITTPNHGADLG